MRMEGISRLTMPLLLCSLFCLLLEPHYVSARSTRDGEVALPMRRYERPYFVQAMDDDGSSDDVYNGSGEEQERSNLPTPPPLSPTPPPSSSPTTGKYPKLLGLQDDVQSGSFSLRQPSISISGLRSAGSSGLEKLNNLVIGPPIADEPTEPTTTSLPAVVTTKANLNHLSDSKQTLVSITAYTTGENQLSDFKRLTTKAQDILSSTATLAIESTTDLLLDSSTTLDKESNDSTPSTYRSQVSERTTVSAYRTDQGTRTMHAVSDATTQPARSPTEQKQEYSSQTTDSMMDIDNTTELFISNSINSTSDYKSSRGETTPKADALMAIQPTTESVLSDGRGSNSMRRVEDILSTQTSLLAELKSQISTLSERVDSQQNDIHRIDQALEDQVWVLTELKQSQYQTDEQIKSMKSNGGGSVGMTTPKTDRETTITSPRISELSDKLESEIGIVMSKITILEDSHLQLSNVVEHIVTAEVWKGESQQNTSSVEYPDHMETTTATLNNSISAVLPDENDILDNEAEIELVEEKTNKVTTSLDMWTRTEQVLHHSLADIHNQQRHYNKELSFLFNYTLNNGMLISELADARMSDGTTILTLLNSTQRIGAKLHSLQMHVMQGQNTTTKSLKDMELTITQLLDLIQLNSLKVITIQEALQGQGSLLGSQLNQSFAQLSNMERSLVNLKSLTDNSLRNVTARLTINKEKTDMLWSRIRILDNRLAHVEVKYLTQELNKYQKSNDDLRQSLKLLEMEGEMETVRENINIQQTNHVTLNGRLNGVSSNVDTMSSSLTTMKSEWTEFIQSLPALRNMYNEVRMIIDLLPKDCDEVYGRGIQTSGVQLTKPSSDKSTVSVYCVIQKEQDTGGDKSELGRGWTVIQQRNSGALDFNKTWTEYKDGFGNVSATEEYWIGNELVHTLTSESNYSVRFDMWTLNNSYVYAEYENFEILAESEGYRLLVSGYHGNATDSLRHSNNMSFSTIDMDNDVSSTHCAQFYTAGWWYKHCHYCNLNGRYTVGVVWFDHNIDDWLELRQTRIMISRRQE